MRTDKHDPAMAALQSLICAGQTLRRRLTPQEAHLDGRLPDTDLRSGPHRGYLSPRKIRGKPFRTKLTYRIKVTCCLHTGEVQGSIPRASTIGHLNSKLKEKLQRLLSACRRQARTVAVRALAPPLPQNQNRIRSEQRKPSPPRGRSGNASTINGNMQPGRLRRGACGSEMSANGKDRKDGSERGLAAITRKTSTKITIPPVARRAGSCICGTVSLPL